MGFGIGQSVPVNASQSGRGLRALQNAGASLIVRGEADRFWSGRSPLPLLVASAYSPAVAVRWPHTALFLALILLTSAPATLKQALSEISSLYEPATL